MTVAELDVVLLVGAVVVLVAVAAVRVSSRLGLPSLLGYLGLGLLLREVLIGGRFDDAALAQTLGYGALLVILAEGGLTTRWSVIRPGLAVAALLSTLGTGVSVGVVAAAAYLLLGFDVRLALVLGAVVSSTDAAAVFSTLRRLRLRPRLVGVLEAESGTNDAPVVLLVTLLSAGEITQSGIPAALATIAYELVAGGALGLAAGWLGVVLLRRAALPASGLYPLAVLGFAVLAYAAANLAHASGFLAVYVAALRLGNADLPHRPATRSFVEGLAWLAQIGLFVMLGLLVSPAGLIEELIAALIVGGVLLLVARPLSVLVCASPLRVPLREQAFLSWAGLRGAVPIVLATIPVNQDLPGARPLFALVFVLVVVFTAVQGPTLPLVARRLQVVAAEETRDVTVDSAPLEELHADLLQLRVPAASRLHNVEIGELRLPVGAAVTLVVRNGRSFVPEPETRLRVGDALLVVTTSAARSGAEQRLRAVSRSGKLAGWLGERGRPS